MKLKSILLHSYVFWALFALVNLEFLAYLALPFLLPLAFRQLHAFVPFLLPPMLCAFVSASAMVVILHWMLSRTWSKAYRSVLLIYVFHSVFLLVFLLAAEFHSKQMMAVQLEQHRPECVEINSFFSSLQHAGRDFQFNAHALFKENGKTYYWSYSTLHFFEGNDRLDRNFPCRGRESRVYADR